MQTEPAVVEARTDCGPRPKWWRRDYRGRRAAMSREQE